MSKTCPIACFMVPLANGGTACVTGTLAISTPRAPLWPMQMQRLKCSHSVQMNQLLANSSPAKGTHLRREENRANNSHLWQFSQYILKWRVATHTRNLCSAFNPSKCTHTVVNTHPEPMLRRPGSSWGFGLTSVVVLKVERMLVIHSPHRQFLPDPRFEPTTSGYKSNALSMRPRLLVALEVAFSRQGCNV